VESASNKKQLAEIEQNNNILTDETPILGGTKTYFKMTNETRKGLKANLQVTHP
jgi:hypothetical protein